MPPYAGSNVGCGVVYGKLGGGAEPTGAVPYGSQLGEKLVPALGWEAYGRLVAGGGAE